MERKPQVFPTQEQQDQAILQAKIDAYEAEKKIVVNEIFNNSANETRFDAVEMMKQRTDNQMRQREETGVVKDFTLAEKPTQRTSEDMMRERTEQQIRLRDEQLRKNLEQTKTFQAQTENASNRHLTPQTPVPPAYVPPIQPPNNNNNNYGQNMGQNPSNINPYIQELSQPQFNAPFDVIPLPSEGKTYRSKRPNVKLAYMTTADENILTSPNLLQSGEFLEILINRKLLDTELRYKDLLPGDRHAIMIWLRATAYGEMYPVTLLDENNEPFDTVFNLDTLKTKKLGAMPDSEGLFDFILPASQTQIKFKLLTVGDIEIIEKMVAADKANEIPVNNNTTYTWERTIVEVNGNRDKNFIREFSQSLRIRDAKELKQYIDKIDSGIELDITIGTPGGGSIDTFLPLNLSFFWPNIKL